MAELFQVLTVKIKVEENIMAVEAAPDEERDSIENLNKDEQVTEQKNQVAKQNDQTTKNQNSEEDTSNGGEEEEEDSFSSMSTVVSCLRRSCSSDLEQQRARVRKDSRSRTLARQRRLLRLGQRARARRLLKVKKINAPKLLYMRPTYRKLNHGYQKCSSAFSTDESYEETDDEDAGLSTSGVQRERIENYTLLENEDSTSSSEGPWRAF